METIQTHNGPLHEEARYLLQSGAHLYTVMHHVERPVARMLIVGPIPSERHYSYASLVSWARYLAERGVEVLRYDHRGIGESEGAFEDFSFEDWGEDLELLASWLSGREPRVPTILHGLEIGAVLAARAFHSGVGDLLILWAPPTNANQTLRSALVRWVALEQMSKYGGERKPASATIRELEDGAFVEVAGYRWSSRFWRDSFAVALPAGILDQAAASTLHARPIKIFTLGREASPLVKAGYLPNEERKDFTWLFTQNWEWLKSSLRPPQEDRR